MRLQPISITEQRMVVESSTDGTVNIADIPADWQLASAIRASVHPVLKDQRMLVHLGLQQSNVDIVNAKFHSVSNPQNADFGKFLTREELRQLVAPSAETIESVVAWLSANNVVGIEFTHSNDFIRVRLTPAQIEQLFNVELFQYQSASNPEVSIVRSATHAVVPSVVAKYINLVHGFTHFPILKSNENKGANKLGATGSVTPQVIKKMYSVTDVFSGRTNASQAVAEFQGQSFSSSDLAKFLSAFSLPSQTVRNITGPNTDVAHIEANLDVQYIIASGQGIPTDVYLAAGEDFNLIGWITDVEANANSALVWSVSYGENIASQTVADVNRLDVEFQKAAILGHTIIFASGDSGVYSRGATYLKFHPGYPACMASVISVGATEYNDDDTETQTTNWSGGGFALSNYVNASQAPWQIAAVQAYLNSGVELPPSGQYDAMGRAFPDVSAFGLNFQIYEGGFASSVSGTSAAAPTFAGIFSLVNDARLAAGKSPLGFPAYFLYQNAQAFNDIKIGYNKASGLYGFHATTGFDPLSGLGTPNYTRLKAAALALP
ncbi:hypothetical protein CAOG_08132 [Capsaspora owczarzaki ATCC 30864]|uniref:Peptidase S53 domain-containing protein n=1 Tax=Capsaspora owczarzaki (strain ATCC 30864) TaxID=595528 RepID=A0A0D2X5N4_CAPO3|nr:hypothetical protein CAOG_08132 [Capsaspora owczarzaki ATCC 30864]KJE98114.1 hypothetical protein CAOG_008132 [Capsaspora owczarzaki ATCC 30864]|eukprot:XP_004342733.1 hypothetical protein CAOG_08132 [Capsaspora owczarzaki ATCC 30864]